MVPFGLRVAEYLSPGSSRPLARRRQDTWAPEQIRELTASLPRINGTGEQRITESCAAGRLIGGPERTSAQLSPNRRAECLLAPGAELGLSRPEHGAAGNS